MFEWEFKGEVTPEELRKRFEEYENDSGYLKSMVIDYLMPYMVREMLRSLVGSEMCIRDRLYSEAEAFLSWPPLYHEGVPWKRF